MKSKSKAKAKTASKINKQQEDAPGIVAFQLITAPKLNKKVVQENQHRIEQSMQVMSCFKQLLYHFYNNNNTDFDEEEEEDDDDNDEDTENTIDETKTGNDEDHDNDNPLNYAFLINCKLKEMVNNIKSLQFISQTFKPQNKIAKEVKLDSGNGQFFFPVTDSLQQIKDSIAESDLGYLLIVEMVDIIANYLRQRMCNVKRKNAK